MAWLVYLSIRWMYPAKTARPIEMPFGIWARVDPINHVIDGGPDPSEEGAFWELAYMGMPGHACGRYIQQDDAAFY